MSTRFNIPKELSHLKIDERGFPIPYFVSMVDGKPNFRLLNREKQIHCVETNRCNICGKKLYEVSYIISGPVGMKNRVSTDPAMHRVCAEFALVVCPHLYYEKAKRVAEGNVPQPHIIQEKPAEMMLIKCKTKFKWKMEKEGIFTYQYISHEVYHYVDGILVKKEL